MTTPGLTTLTEVHKLEERYPFKEEEIEILVRCHDHLKNSEDNDDFLMKLALASPYSHYFLPGDEQRARVSWIEDQILPAGFANELRAAISADAFVEYANQGSEKSLERFIEGVADTGRRGSKEALRVLYNIVGAECAKAEDVIDICFRLAVASDVLSEANLDKNAVLSRLEGLETIVQAVAQSLVKACGEECFPLQSFVGWAEDTFPMLSAPLSTFIHNLLFHGHAYPDARIPYMSPRLDHSSDVFDSVKPLSLTALSFATPSLGGKWHRLYGEMDGRSFNRLEWSLLGYGGPTVLVVKTTCNAVLGAFVPLPWKQSKDFYGNRDFFLFRISPSCEIFHATGSEEHFMYMHSRHVHGPIQTESGWTPHGIGFGGCFEKPRLFIPETFEHCSGDFLDHTYESGNLLPTDSLEKFEIKSLEVWGVGGDEVVAKALRHRAEYRERTEAVTREAQAVHDKSFIAKDMQTGLITDTLFTHQDVVRGRHDFRVDDVHGGYKVEH